MSTASIHVAHAPLGPAPGHRSPLCVSVGVRKFGTELCFLPVWAWIAATTWGWLTRSFLSRVWPPPQDACRISLGLTADFWVIMSNRIREWCISCMIWVTPKLCFGWSYCKYTLLLAKQREISTVRHQQRHILLSHDSPTKNTEGGTLSWMFTADK